MRSSIKSRHQCLAAIPTSARPKFVRWILPTALLWVSPQWLWAQAPPPAPVVTSARSWYFEALIVVIMMGLALFVVCRSSRRN